MFWKATDVRVHDGVNLIIYEEFLLWSLEMPLIHWQLKCTQLFLSFFHWAASELRDPVLFSPSKPELKEEE